MVKLPSAREKTVKTLVPTEIPRLLENTQRKLGLTYLHSMHTHLPNAMLRKTILTILLFGPLS